MKKSLGSVAKMGALMMAIILFFTSWKMIAGVTGNPPGKYEAMQALLSGPYAINFWVGEVALGMIIPFVLVLVLGLSVFPQEVVDRIASTYQGQSAFGSAGEQLGLDPSAAQRIDIWWWTLDKLKQHPLIGFGITGVGLVDQQYCLVLGESGLIGMGLYLWTRWLIIAFLSNTVFYRILEL